MVEGNFFYILDITIHNISIVYSYSKVNSIKYNYGVNFRKYLLEEMAKKYNTKSMNNAKIKTKYILISGNKTKQECKICRKNGRVDNNRHAKRTNNICKYCNIYICKECFIEHIENIINSL